MKERDPKKQETATDPVLVIIDRRKEKHRDLSSAEIMKLVRKRSAKIIREEAGSVDEYSK